MADERSMVNPIEIAIKLEHYACLPRSRGSERGHAELLGARVIETQQAEIERLRGLIIEWDNAELAADAVFSGPETVVADRRLSKAMDNLIKEARRG